jgi:hypothetical protein
MADEPKYYVDAVSKDKVRNTETYSLLLLPEQVAAKLENLDKQIATSKPQSDFF